MARKTVYFTTGASCAVTVDVAADADEADIIDLAAEELPAGLCASCSGWGDFVPYTVDLGDWEPDDDAVTDA